MMMLGVVGELTTFEDGKNVGLSELSSKGDRPLTILYCVGFEIVILRMFIQNLFGSYKTLLWSEISQCYIYLSKVFYTVAAVPIRAS
jgi:hypothetical protein